jgi:Flp pilus assembly pilin Flp
MNHLSLRRHNRRNKRGQTLVEYALILAFIAVVAVGVLYALGFNVTGVFSNVTSQMSNATAASSGSGSGSGSGNNQPSAPPTTLP